LCEQWLPNNEHRLRCNGRSAAQTSWERKCWHLGTRRFACEADARAALERELKGKPTWLEVPHVVVAHPRHAGKGRPRKDASPTTHQWQIVATVTINQHQVDEEALHKACFIVGTNQLESEALSDQELVTTYKDQGGVERGFRGSRKIRCFWPPRSSSRNRSGSSP